MKSRLDRIFEAKVKPQIVEGTVSTVHGDGTVTVSYGGRSRRMRNASPNLMFSGGRVLITQLDGNPAQAFVSGLSPKVPYEEKVVWV